MVKKPSAEQVRRCESWPIWQGEPGTFDWAYTQKEICFLIKGKVRVSDQSGSVSFGAGDMVIFPKELECTWCIEEAVKKHYTFE